MSYANRKWFGSQGKLKCSPLFRLQFQGPVINRVISKHGRSWIHLIHKLKQRKMRKITCSEALTKDAQVKAVSIIRKRFSGDIGHGLFHRKNFSLGAQDLNLAPGGQTWLLMSWSYLVLPFSWRFATFLMTSIISSTSVVVLDATAVVKEVPMMLQWIHMKWLMPSSPQLSCGEVKIG